MDTHRLSYFLAIAEEGSMTKAAATLGIAQPALSRQLHRLEEQLGVKLFHRTARGMELTDEGERLRAGTAVPLRQLELAVRYAGSSLARVERGLRLGLLESTLGVLAHPLLSVLASAFPKLTVTVTASDTDSLISALTRGALDIVITDQVADNRLFGGELITEDVVVLGGATSDLTPEVPFLFGDVEGLPLVLPRSRNGLRTSLENADLRCRLLLQPRYATDSLQLTKDLIQSGAAFGLLPRSACADEIESGRIRWAPLADPAVSQTLMMASTREIEIPRGLAIQIGQIIHDEVGRLAASGRWPGRPIPPLRTHRSRADLSPGPH